MPSKPRGSLGRVLVIGGNGFLGHHIVNQAVAHWTTTTVSSIDLRCDKNRNSHASYHECDITDRPKLQALLEQLKPDVVIHTASPTASGESKTVKELFRKVNVEGTRSVVEACQQVVEVKALVYTSSASVISDNQNDLVNADERWPVIRGAQQKEYYSETKAAAEELALLANRSSLLTTALRPAGIFGEGDVQTLAGFLKAYHTGKSHIQLGDNTNIFDFTYVGNVAHAHLLAAQALLLTSKATTTPLDHERVDGQVFIITNDSPCYFWDFARAVWAAAGNTAGTEGVWTLGRGTSLTLGGLSEIFYSIIGKPPTFTRTRANMATMTRYYNITKAKSVLGYEPLWTLQDGVARGVTWFLDEEKKKGVIKAQ
ncbi:erg26, C-3 sterol dehydrogenase [Conoideocrella luteorostrata]|uniref:Sterol-4-alpha-carboxylate 3-dehydrogenase ERG26, decarboxylating n=1 Tax=Conoideocrella luteorostrata TaxID=1105319 RepID=A0AAJ0CSE7_9HYPO|nr:erg26, C-3 sterol dehydrogenase [Conoideocrella luteorostrata]